jgi:hypothetical protein
MIEKTIRYRAEAAIREHLKTSKAPTTAKAIFLAIRHKLPTTTMREVAYIVNHMDDIESEMWTNNTHVYSLKKPLTGGKKQ